MRRGYVGIRVCLLVCFVFASTSMAKEPLQLANLFNDSMVLPSGTKIPVWGWSEPGSTITATLGDQTASTTSDEQGLWTIEFASRNASYEAVTLLVQSGDERIELHDLLFGRVWLAAGQSNMQWTLGQSIAERADLAQRVTLDESVAIRVTRIDLGPEHEAKSDLPHRTTWTKVTPETASQMSGVAFFFAQRMSSELLIPFGIIDVSRGGTPIEPFIPREAFVDHPTLEAELRLGDAEDLAGLKALRGGVFARDAAWLPGRLFNSRIAPLTKFPIAGAIWYQGESNSGTDEDPTDYRYKMDALRDGWRNAFSQSELQVHYVQLPGSGAGPNWPQLREEQRVAEQRPLSGMVVTIDLEGEGIHPWNKFDVGERLARIALAEEPSDETRLPSSGPRFASVVREEDAIVVHFDCCSGLWIGRKSGTDSPMPLRTRSIVGFEIQLPSGQWQAADATLDGTSVRVTGDGIADAKAVRYAWSPTPTLESLYDDSMLPASPLLAPVE